MSDEELMAAAVKARESAYAPYSRFKVGAALLTKDGRLYTGCNVENAAYGSSNCAERTAFFTAVAAGERAFGAIAIAGWRDGQPGFAFPCGVCRQVMAEFCKPESFRIVVTDGVSSQVMTLKNLLPYGFGPENLA